MSTQMRRAVLADRLLPTKNVSSSATLIVAGSVLVALSAQLSFPLPFTPVPLTGQTFGVLLVGMLLGPGRGALSLLLYLLEGAIGLPVFAGFSGGVVHLLGPSGGYLIGFVLAAAVCGWLAQRGGDRSFAKTSITMLAGNAAIYLVGVPWLAAYVSWERALALGLTPFVVGDVLKLLVAAWLLPTLWEKTSKR